MKYFKQKPETIKEITDQSLWLNEYIKINKMYVYFKNLEIKGIHKIIDIIDNSAEVLSYEELKTKYNIETNFLQTIHIHKSIPQPRLEKIKNSNLTQVSRSTDIKIKVNKIYKI